LSNCGLSLEDGRSVAAVGIVATSSTAESPVIGIALQDAVRIFRRPWHEGALLWASRSCASLVCNGQPKGPAEHNVDDGPVHPSA
jgi:hypothetical protein